MVLTTAINVRILNDIQSEIKKFENNQIKTVPVELEDEEYGWHRIARIYDMHLIEQAKRLKLRYNSHVVATIAEGSFVAKDGKRYDYYKIKTLEIFDIQNNEKPTNTTSEEKKEKEKEENGMFSCLKELNTNPFG